MSMPHTIKIMQSFGLAPLRAAVDLNPTSLSGISYSVAYNTNGVDQVGYGYGTGNIIGKRLLWTGTASSAFDLQTLLPASGTWSDSYAFSVDSSGNVYGTADGTYQGVGSDYAVEWSPVPEPSTCALLFFTCVGILAGRHRKQ